MIEFVIHGPFTVAYEISRRGRGGRPKKIVSRQIGRDFWASLSEDHAYLAGHKGCYVFALRARRGSMPWYVGKTEKTKRTLKQEVFSDDKLAKYKAILNRSKRRSPEIYFTTRITSRGRLGAAIDDLETLLIWVASHRNEDLINQKKRKTQPARLVRIMNRTAIRGLLNSGPRAPTTSATLFDQVLHFRERV